LKIKPDRNNKFVEAEIVEEEKVEDDEGINLRRR